MTLLDNHSFDLSLRPLFRTLRFVAVMTVAIGLDVYFQRFAHFSSPGLFLLPAVAIIGMEGGSVSAFAAAGVSIIFVAITYSNRGSILSLQSDAVIRLCLLAVSAPIIAFVVGIQRKRIKEAENGRVERALRARAEELSVLADALKRSNSELDQFAYVTSHDLKSPLRGINNLSQWIEEDLGDRVTPEARVQLGLLRGRVHRMESLINGLLEYSHVGRTQGKLEHVDINKLLAEIKDWVSPPDEISLDIAQGMPVFVTDKIRLQQVLTNLIENAVKHRGNVLPELICITCNDAGLFYQFSVSDNGPGIDPRFHDRIFEVFQTLVPRDQLEGTGIGLSLVRKIVARMGGTVWVESAIGHGAKFSFTWPKSGRALDSK